MFYNYGHHMIFRKKLLSLVPSDAQNSLSRSPDGVAPEVDLTNLALRLLPSKNGVVLRRLLMNAVSTCCLL